MTNSSTDVSKAAARLSHLSLHPHGSTDPAKQQSATTHAHSYSLGDRATAPHLVNILRHVGLGDRLRSCARVSRSWSKAAVEATDTIVSIKPDLDDGSLLSMWRWLRKHGKALSKLQAVLPGGRTPGEDLAEVWARNQQYVRGLAAATNLTSLSLKGPGAFRCIVPELASLQSLQQLELLDVKRCEVYLPEPCAHTLQQLTTLTHLKLGGSLCDATDYMPMGMSLQCVWALTQLRSVDIECWRSPRPFHPRAFEGLSGMTQLSSFSLSAPSLSVVPADHPRNVVPGQEAVPGLTELTQLQVLKLQSENPINGFGGVQPSMFTGFTNLEHLVLQMDYLVPSDTGAQDLLGLLPQLQQLTALELSISLNSSPCTALTALTASSRLRYLNLDDIRLPSGAWQHVFAPNRLLQLEALSLVTAQPCLRLINFQCIVRCCPNLKALSIDSAPTEALPLLTSLTKLRTAYEDAEDTYALVQQLGGLRDLELEYYCNRNPDGLLELTGLQQLTRLKFDAGLDILEDVEFLQLDCLPCRSPDVSKQWLSWWQANADALYRQHYQHLFPARNS